MAACACFRAVLALVCVRSGLGDRPGGPDLMTLTHQAR